MTDYRLAWTTQRADRLQQRHEAAALAATELGERWIELHGHVTAGSGGGAGGGAALASHEQIPVRVDVEDFLLEVRAWVSDSSALCRGTLRGRGPDVRSSRVGQQVRTDAQRTVGSLLWVGRVIPDVHEADPDLARDIVRRTFQLNHRAGVTLGIVPRAFPIERTCPECGMRALWADPDTWTVTCGMSTCRTCYPIDSPRLAHTTETAPA